jgi:ubiquitin fusion degradation protein 1
MFGLNQFFNDARPFNVQYKCYSPAMMSDRTDIEDGGKIILPPSALEWLTRLNTMYPMLFKLTNPSPQCQRSTHCGVLEFVANEGECLIPYWMMKNLLIGEGQIVQVESIALSVATYAKFKPQSTDFLNISNPRAVLELQLRNFACLTKNDIIPINYNNKIYEMLVQDVKPANAVCIIECDMNVEFDAPEGYVHPTPEPRSDAGNAGDQPMDLTDLPASNTGFVPFAGEGHRVDGKTIKENAEEVKPKYPVQERKRGIPNYNYKVGKLTFIRTVRPLTDNNDKEPEKAFEAFSGPGNTVRGSRGQKK